MTVIFHLFLGHDTIVSKPADALCSCPDRAGRQAGIFDAASALLLVAFWLGMILSDSVAAVREIIAMSAGPFVFIGLPIWLYVKKEPGDGAGGTPGNLRDDKKGCQRKWI